MKIQRPEKDYTITGKLRLTDNVLVNYVDGKCTTDHEEYFCIIGEFRLFSTGSIEDATDVKWLASVLVETQPIQFRALTDAHAYTRISKYIKSVVTAEAFPWYEGQRVSTTVQIPDSILFLNSSPLPA